MWPSGPEVCFSGTPLRTGLLSAASSAPGEWSEKTDGSAKHPTLPNSSRRPSQQNPPSKPLVILSERSESKDLRLLLELSQILCTWRQKIVAISPVPHLPIDAPKPSCDLVSEGITDSLATIQSELHLTTCIDNATWVSGVGNEPRNHLKVDSRNRFNAPALRRNDCTGQNASSPGKSDPRMLNERS